VLVMTYLVGHHSFAAPEGEYGATVQKIAISHLQVRLSRTLFATVPFPLEFIPHHIASRLYPFLSAPALAS
jgi:hypothetical protein